MDPSPRRGWCVGTTPFLDDPGRFPYPEGTSRFSVFDSEKTYFRPVLLNPHTTGSVMTQVFFEQLPSLEAGSRVSSVRDLFSTSSWYVRFDGLSLVVDDPAPVPLRTRRGWVWVVPATRLLYPLGAPGLTTLMGNRTRLHSVVLSLLLHPRFFHRQCT